MTHLVVVVKVFVAVVGFVAVVAIKADRMAIANFDR
jgi:hypothetical protein